jgi:molybdate transport system substrate-binding protein
MMISLCMWMAASLSVSAQSQPVTVFAAASLKTVLDDVAKLYRRQTGKHVQASYAASSALARQIQYGAPADIFISANASWMDWLQQDGLLDDETRVDLLSNRLVLIAATENKVALEMAADFDLSGALGQSWLAMALVNAVPAGIYGKAALQSLGVWSAIEGRVAQSDNVRTALMLVASGEALMGVVYLTDAKIDPRVRVVGTFPVESHPEIRYPAALVQDSSNPDAIHFLDFLTGPEARQKFDEYGFDRPGATR